MLMFLICVILEIWGYIDYTGVPVFLWKVLDMIPLLAACCFGLSFGILCLMPAVVSELAWFFIKGVPGALLFIASFTAVILIGGCVYKVIMKSDFSEYKRTILLFVNFQICLIIAEVFLHMLRHFILGKPEMTMSHFTYLTLSWGNVICIALFCSYLIFIKIRKL